MAKDGKQSIQSLTAPTKVRKQPAYLLWAKENEAVVQKKLDYLIEEKCTESGLLAGDELSGRVLGALRVKAQTAAFKDLPKEERLKWDAFALEAVEETRKKKRDEEEAAASMERTPAQYQQYVATNCYAWRVRCS